jgi:hypothetical protein
MGIAFSGADIAKVLIIVAVVGTTSLVIFFFILRGHINLWRSKDEKHLATIIPLTWFVFIIFSYFIAYKVYPEFARHSSLPIGGNFEEVESFIIIVTLISLLSCSQPSIPLPYRFHVFQQVFFWHLSQFLKLKEARGGFMENV